MKTMSTATLCHGPVALHSNQKQWVGICLQARGGIPHASETKLMPWLLPSFGYLPGSMPWKSQKGLEKEGFAITNATEMRGVSPRAAILTIPLENFYITTVCGASHPSACQCTDVFLNGGVWNGGTKGVLNNYLFVLWVRNRGWGSNPVYSL